MSQLKPSSRESICKFLRILIEMSRNFLVFRVKFQSQICCQHSRSMFFGWIMSIRNCSCTCSTFWSPLIGSSWTFGQFPIKSEKIFKEVIAPFCRGSSPSHFNTTGDSISGISSSIGVLPSHTHFFDRSSCRFCSYKFCWICCTVGFTESMSTSDKRYSFVIIHSHTAKSLTNISSSSDWIWLTFWSFWVHIDQTHVSCT